MTIRDFSYTGHPNEVIDIICEHIDLSIKNKKVSSFKVGITRNPQQRFTQEYAGNYDCMFIYYKTSSEKHIRLMEAEVINYASQITNKVKNKISGGGGNMGDPPYYLYTVISF